MGTQDVLITELPHEVSAELDGALTIRDGIIVLRDREGMGARRISRWMKERGVSIGISTADHVLRRRVTTRIKEAGDPDKHLCTACGHRRKAAGNRYLCADCFRDGDSDVLGEYQVNSTDSRP